MKTTLPQPEMTTLLKAEYVDPSRIFGMHAMTRNGKKTVVVRAFLAGVEQACVYDPKTGQRYPMTCVYDGGFFEAIVPRRRKTFPYQLETTDKQGNIERFFDPYSFPPVLSDEELARFAAGTHETIYDKFGCHPLTLAGVSGAFFAVWAPHARRVSVIGDFNDWDGRAHPMRLRKAAGVWELFIPGVREGERYKYEVTTPAGYIYKKTDPYGFQFELRPQTSSIVTDIDRFAWTDQEWMQQRAQTNPLRAPVAVYEVHLGSWMQQANQAAEHGFLNYRELADRLIRYVKAMGFTHIELLPITEHPFDASWGYQVTGYFAPTSRYGSPADFMYFVNACHAAGIGVIVDWVPAHFPRDGHSLAYFDGTSLYEYEDPRSGEHKGWGTLIFDYRKNEVKNFLLASAVFWFEKFHIDGIRVDAVASMLYLDYSRQPGEWVPNEFGGNENLEAIKFLQALNSLLRQRFPGIMTMGEESTAWLGVTRPIYLGGLGFTLKWNLGWMHDTLYYLSHEPQFRKTVHTTLPLTLLYAFHEHFMLTLSHDEVVHCKGSLLAKMPGNEWQQFANLRLLYGLMIGHPGKKLLFMGAEFGQRREWDHDNALDWNLLEHPLHQGLQTYVRALNHLYLAEPALFRDDTNRACFEWIDHHDITNSVFVFLRRTVDDANEMLIFVCNCTPTVQQTYQIGVPLPGHYREAFNSDAAEYGGSHVTNPDGCDAEPISWQHRPYSISLTLPPLSVVVLKPVGGQQREEQITSVESEEAAELQPLSQALLPVEPNDAYVPVSQVLLPVASDDTCEPAQNIQANRIESLEYVPIRPDQGQPLLPQGKNGESSDYRAHATENLAESEELPQNERVDVSETAGDRSGVSAKLSKRQRVQSGQYVGYQLFEAEHSSATTIPEGGRDSSRPYG